MPTTKTAPLAGLVVMLLTATTLGTSAMAQSEPPGPERGLQRGPEYAERMMGRLFDRLHLSAEQRTRMQEIRKRNMEATRDMRNRLMERRHDLMLLVRKADATREQAFALQSEIDGLQSKLARARIAAWFEARAVLTPEQLAKLATVPLWGNRPHRPRP